MNKQRHYIEAVRHKNLVYLRTLKCASTFFYRNFRENLMWQTIPWSNIDWENDHVFSHIMEPVKRRHKAVAQRLFMLGLCDQYINDSNLQECLEHSLMLDQHGENYSTRYGTACNLIDWIPLQPDKRVNITLTEALLSESGVTNIKWDYRYSHTGDDIKKQVEKILETRWNQALVPGRDFLPELLPEWLQNELQQDIDLYRNITQSFDNNAKSWRNITWRKKHDLAN